MSKKTSETKISGNSTAKEMKDALPLLKVAGGALGFLGKLGINKEKFSELGAMATNLEEQSKILELPDRFNELFAAKGWICVGSALSVIGTMGTLPQPCVSVFDAFSLFLTLS
jgi:hypothetical protein